jgi:WbqC-like protein family.
MIAAIHQHHYFPWLGYMDKMARADVFLLLDRVQLNDNSYMFRHQLLDKNGEKKYITIPFQKKGYMLRAYNELELNPAVDWQTRQKNFICDNYRRHPFFREIWHEIEPVFTEKYSCLWEVTDASVQIMRRLLGVTTPLVYQSSMDEAEGKKSEFLIGLLRQLGADRYLSGSGAKKYMDMEMFERAGIRVTYQQFSLPHYPQKNSSEFVGGISGLDILFNCGVDETRRIFWDNVSHEQENEK